MHHSTSLLPPRDGSLRRPHRAGGEHGAPWAVVEDVAVGAALCAALWFFTSMAFLA
jgi:hypothetical protein